MKGRGRREGGKKGKRKRKDVTLVFLGGKRRERKEAESFPYDSFQIWRD